VAERGPEEDERLQSHRKGARTHTQGTQAKPVPEGKRRKRTGWDVWT